MLHFGRIAIVPFLRLLVLGLFAPLSARAEIIYDNTSTFLNRVFNEKSEYGDQVDLGGTARRLTQILFEYYGEFEQQGDEMVKVRVYRNETPYDRYRKAPTTLIYESGWMPINPGYNTRAISGLNVQLPFHTVTVTVEFSGIAETETAGLLFYGPPSIGYSFNEIWLRAPAGNWASVLYSSSDPLKRASAGLRLVAEPDIRLDQHQVTSVRNFPMLEGTNRVRIAQTFSPEISGRLSDVTVQLQFTNAPVRVRILDAIGQVPGPNVLGEITLLSGAGVKQRLPFIDEHIYLKAGAQYAIEFSTSADFSASPAYLVPVARDSYRRGDLWRRSEAGGRWTAATENNDGFTPLDAVFETYVIPAVPDVEILSPKPGQTFDATEPIELRASHRPAEIGTIAHIRFLNGTQEIGRATNAPYVLLWTNAPQGELNLRAIAEDSFRRPFRSEIVPVTVNPPGPPENDQFARRILLSGTAARSIKPTAAATLEPNEPLAATSIAGATLWWSWTAHDNSPVSISARQSSDPQVRIAVFTGTSLATLQGVTNGLSRVDFRPSAGVTYAIVVDPQNRGEQVVLDLAVADVRILRITPNIPRSASPVTFDISGSASRRITNVTLVANSQPLQSASAAPASLTHSFNSSGDVTLQLVATDDRGILTVSTPYQITVRPENDSFRHATLLTGGGGTVPFTSFAATPELIDPIAFGEESRSVWFQWQMPAAGFLTLETPPRGNASTFAVYTARTNGALVLLDAVAQVNPSDPTPRLGFQVAAGQLYYFFAASATPETSSFTYDFRIFQVSASLDQNGSLSLQFMTGPNQRVYIEASTDLITWQRIGEVIDPSGKFVQWSDPAVPPQAPDGTSKARFYRVNYE